MSDNTYFMAFSVSDRLHRDAENFIERFVYSGNPGDRSHALLFNVMEEFVYECLRVYFVEPCAKAGLSPASRKIVDSTVAVIRKTVAFVLGKLVYKLDRQQMKAVAQYMDEIMQRERGSFAVPAFIAFPLPEKWVKNFCTLEAEARSSVNPPDLDRLVVPFNELTDLAIEHFFEAPLNLISLGAMSRRMAEMGIETARAATRALLKQIFKTMTPEQIRDILALFNAMIARGPAHLAIQTTSAYG